ncbi:MAG: hypothetical protein OEW45_05865 [Deltaproteobacteria bacterium]|nr:hypothetical protein [Deltaproteobacteria bacterium]
MKPFASLLMIFIILNSLMIMNCKSNSGESKKTPLIFATFAEDQEQLHHTLILAESIRTFAGKFKDAPIWVYIPENLKEIDRGILNKFDSLEVELKTVQAPEEALKFYFARKVFAAAKAEAEAEEKAGILVWMDEDTIVLQEPKEFLLEQNLSLGYRPVMHKNIGSLYSEPPDKFWSRIYEKLYITQSSLFPMITPADQDTLRPYFNAGLLVVRPRAGILRKWAEYFPILYKDSILVDMCEQDRLKKIFLHQVALVGAILNTLKQEETVDLSLRYNYPIFFKAMYGATKEFDSLDNVVTLRYDVYFSNPEPDWARKLKGPEKIISWLKERLGKK